MINNTDDKQNKYFIWFIALLIIPACLMNAQVNTEKKRSSKKGDHFNITLGFSFSLFKGNTDLFSLDSDVRLDYQKGKASGFLIGNIIYGEKSKVSHLNKGFAHLRLIRQISKRLFLEAFTQEEFNKFIRLKERSLVGGGLRILLLKPANEKKGLTLYAGIGMMYERERFIVSDFQLDKPDSSLAKSTNYISINYSSPIFSLNNVSYLQFNIGETSSTRIYSDLTFSVKLSKLIAYTAGGYYRYRSDPAPGVKTYDLRVKNGFKLFLK